MPEQRFALLEPAVGLRVEFRTSPIRNIPLVPVSILERFACPKPEVGFPHSSRHFRIIPISSIPLVPVFQNSALPALNLW